MAIDPKTVQWDAPPQTVGKPVTGSANEPLGGGVIIPAAPDKPEKPNLPVGFELGPDGVARRIPGIPDPNNPNEGAPTESERTAGFLAGRIVDAVQRLAPAAQKNPEAQSPSTGVEMVRGIAGDTAANFFTSPERRQIYAAQRDILDAALTLGTGAAYTKEQLAGYETSYLPQLYDDPDTVQSKRQALRTLLQEAAQKAGRSAPDIDAAIAALDQLPDIAVGDQPAPEGLTGTVTDTSPAGPSMMDSVATGLGRGLGDVIEGGVNNTIGLAVNPVGQLMYNAMPGNQGTYDIGRSLREGLGLPDNPDSMASSIIQGAAGGLGGAAMARGGAQLASGAMRSGLETLGSTPGRDFAGGAGAAAGSQIAASQGAGAGGQIAGALLGGGLAAGSAGVRTPGAIAAGDRALVQAAEQNRVPLMTSDAMPPQTFIGKSAQFTGERIPIAGTGGKRATQQEARVDAVKRIASEYGANEPALLERVSADLLATRSAELTKYATAKDEVISSLAGAGEVPSTNATQVIDDKIAELTRRGTPAAQEVVSYLTRLRTDIQGKSLDQIEAIRKDELSQAFKSGETMAEVRSVGEKAVRPIYRALNEDMGEFIKGAGDRRDFAKWKVANTRLAQMAGELDVTALKQALRKGDVTPETVGNVLFSQKPSDVRALYGNLSANGKANARAAILARAIEKAGGLEEVSPQRFANEVARLGASTGVMFNGTDAARLSGLVKVLKATRRAGDAAVSTASGQQTYLPATLGALADVWGTGGAIVGSLATVGALARAYESPAVRDIMLRLGRTKKGDKSEAFLVKRAITALAQQDNEQ